MISRCLFVSLFALSSTIAVAQLSLQSKVTELAESISGDVGVAIQLLERGDTLSYHGNHPFPMQSVYKFPLALAIMHDVDNGKISLDEMVLVSKTDYSDTYAPLMQKYPDAGVKLSIKELLEYTVELSDNVACDILFRTTGGPRKVDLFVHGQDVRDMAIRNTEREMHANEQLQYQNWSTPKAMAQLLHTFYNTDMLSAASRELLWEMLVDTKVGLKRIKGLLPEGTVVGHRTGTGATTKDRLTSAINDAGIIELPTGERLIVVVFITNTREDVPDAEEVIAKIARAAYDHFVQKK